MRIKDIKEFVEQSPNESNVLEYKRELESDYIVKPVAAMANHGGGKIIIGINDDNGEQNIEKRITGIECTKKYDAANLGKLLHSYLSPCPQIETTLLEHNNKKVVMIDVNEVLDNIVICFQDSKKKDQNRKPIFQKGDIFIRNNTSSEKISEGTQMRDLIERVCNTRVRAEIEKSKDCKQTPSNIHSPDNNKEGAFETSSRKLAKNHAAIEQTDKTRDLLLSPMAEGDIYTAEVLEKAFRKTKVNYYGSSLSLPKTQKTDVPIQYSEKHWIFFNKGEHHFRQCLVQNNNGGLYVVHKPIIRGDAEAGKLNLSWVLQEIVLYFKYAKEYLRNLNCTDNQWKLEVKIRNFNKHGLQFYSSGFGYEDCNDVCIADLITANIVLTYQDLCDHNKTRSLISQVASDIYKKTGYKDIALTGGFEGLRSNINYLMEGVSMWQESGNSRSISINGF